MLRPLPCRRWPSPTGVSRPPSLPHSCRIWRTLASTNLAVWVADLFFGVWERPCGVFQPAWMARPQFVIGAIACARTVPTLPRLSSKISTGPNVSFPTQGRCRVDVSAPDDCKLSTNGRIASWVSFLSDGPHWIQVSFSFSSRGDDLPTSVRCLRLSSHCVEANGGNASCISTVHFVCIWSACSPYCPVVCCHWEPAHWDLNAQTTPWNSLRKDTIGVIMIWYVNDRTIGWGWCGTGWRRPLCDAHCVLLLMCD